MILEQILTDLDRIEKMNGFLPPIYRIPRDDWTLLHEELKSTARVSIPVGFLAGLDLSNDVGDIYLQEEIKRQTGNGPGAHYIELCHRGGTVRVEAD